MIEHDEFRKKENVNTKEVATLLLFLTNVQSVSELHGITRIVTFSTEIESGCTLAHP